MKLIRHDKNAAGRRKIHHNLITTDSLPATLHSMYFIHLKFEFVLSLLTEIFIYKIIKIIKNFFYL